MDGATPAAGEGPDGRYPEDLAYIHASGFGDLAAIAGPAIVGLHDAGIDGGLVVDVGCGNGITSRSLLEAGYDVLGIDTSEPFLRRARREAAGARFRQGSFLDEPLPECSAVIAVGEVLAYLPPHRAGLAPEPRDPPPAASSAVPDRRSPTPVGFRARLRRGYTGERFAPAHYVVVARKASGPSARPRRGTGED